MLLVTTFGAMMIAGAGFPSPWIVLWTLLGGALAIEHRLVKPDAVHDRDGPVILGMDQEERRRVGIDALFDRMAMPQRLGRVLAQQVIARSGMGIGPLPQTRYSIS